ncbi:energy-coupled thiamine transporter ThiT [Terribacillus sp. DMT04]|uniref:energy-coupled thiamine transporter ThiT n=1 Tax=Terribacillus sp. DMT04 TaxID=2850441 RepID=UPI001C2C36E4|nr:energy-coupled thiamine transporter ThiT [Terribacillus sp. DMT04]QXE02930.1 energy-coupled thiamine transporter ThiT [Terribacillus sp. DMT04]
MQSRSKVLFLVEVAIFAALAVVLDLFSFKAWAQGGSISLQMVPIFLMAFRWGWKGGLVTGLVVGLLQLVTGPYIIHVVQGFLDYPAAFTLVGFAAVTSGLAQKAARQNNRFKLALLLIAGTLIGSVGRFAAHFVGGMVFFGSAAAPGQSVWVYSLIYNGSYLLPSFIASMAVIIILVFAQPKLILPK